MLVLVNLVTIGRDTPARFPLKTDFSNDALLLHFPFCYIFAIIAGTIIFFRSILQIMHGTYHIFTGVISTYIGLILVDLLLCKSQDLEAY